MSKVPPYAIAVLCVALAAVLKWAVDPVADQVRSPMLFFITAVAVSACYGGLLPGLVTLGLSAAIAAHSFLPPGGSLRVEEAGAWYRLLAFAFEGLIICSVCEALHRSRGRAEALTAEARDALRARRSSEARFRRLADSDVIGVIAGRDERIVEANDAFLRMLGLGRDRLRDGGLSVAAITPEPYREQDERLFAALFREGTLAPFEKEYLAADGRHISVLVGGAVVEPGGSEWVAFVLDLSRQKRAEHALAEATSRAEAASRAKSEFLAVLSHELITPMNAIIGMNRLVLANERDPTLRDYLGTARESAEALLALLSDLLDYSSIEAGGFELDPGPMRLRAAIDQAVRPLATRAARKGLGLVAEVADDVPEGLVGDSRRLRQVLVNLLDNAIKFTRRGEVTLAVGLDPDAPSGDEVALRFEVADTGIGIAPGDRDRIFSPFTQIDGTSTRPYSGTGLGLSICRQIVGLMGGAIALESAPGRGSRFSFSARFRPLPEAGPEPPRPSSAARPTPGRPAPRPLRILLAEDTPANQKLALAVLRRRGHRVDVAADGREAVELAGRQRYDLVLMDVQMPVMDGLQATAAIRALGGDSGPDVPIVALTAHALRGDRERCLRAGMDGYIAKPIEVDSFLDVVEAYGPRLDRDRDRDRDRGPGGNGDGPEPGPTPDAGRSTPGGAREEPMAGDDPETLYDRRASLRRLGGDEELYRDMIGYFLEDYPGLLDQLRRGLLGEDARIVERAAHSLKGLAANCGSGPAATAAARVEEIGREGALRKAPEAVERLVSELRRLRDALAADPAFAGR